MQSSIAITKETKERLAEVKVHPRESYEDAIKRLLEQRQRSATNGASVASETPQA